MGGLPARLADLVEACSGAVWLAHGWPGLARFADDVVHPLAPVTAATLADGWTGEEHEGIRRAHEVLGASVLEVAAADLAYRSTPGPPAELTALRNTAYATAGVLRRARAAGLLDPRDGGPAAAEPDPVEAAAERDVVELALARTALDAGLDAALAMAAEVVGLPSLT